MKFKFIIVDLENWTITGTNSERAAKELRLADTMFVVDVEKSVILDEGGLEQTIVEDKTYELPDISARPITAATTLGAQYGTDDGIGPDNG